MYIFIIFFYILHKNISMTKKDIGQTVTSIIKKKKVSRYAINKDTGVQPAQVKSIEKGDANYTIDSLVSVCEYLGITIHTTHKG